MGICKNEKIFVRSTLLIILTIVIFVYSESYQRYEKIEEFTSPLSLEKEDGFYYDITQDYPLIELESFENVLTKILQKIKYDKICFRDEGSKIIHGAFIGSDLNVTIIYLNKTKEVAYIRYDKTINSKEQCFNIINKREIRWNWGFRSNVEITDSFLRVVEFQDAVISPNVSTYLKISISYYILSLFLSLFYSGIFLWALTRIKKFIEDGFN